MKKSFYFAFLILTFSFHVLLMADDHATLPPSDEGGACTVWERAEVNESNTWTLTSGPTTCIALELFSQQIAIAIPVNIGNDFVTMDWTLVQAISESDNGEPVELSFLVCNVDSAGASLTSFSGAFEITLSMAAAISVAQETFDPNLMGVGSSCSCPVCPGGGQFLLPFSVVIVSGKDSQACCAAACAAACGSIALGNSPFYAWWQGQGVWVTCMVCT